MYYTHQIGLKQSSKIKFRVPKTVLVFSLSVIYHLFSHILYASTSFLLKKKASASFKSNLLTPGLYFVQNK